MLQHPHLGLDGWLIYDYRRSNPIFWQIVAGQVGMVTRPCFLFVAASGEPRLLVHHVDAGKFQTTAVNLVVYRSRQTMLDSLKNLLPSGGRVAMEYSPGASMPRVSMVDASTVELVRGLGVDVVPSADLLQYASQRWSGTALDSHLRSAAQLGRIVLEAFEYIGLNLVGGVTEYQVAQFIRARFTDEGLHSPDGPIVATNAHASDPHYEPAPQGKQCRPGR